MGFPLQHIAVNHLYTAKYQDFQSISIQIKGILLYYEMK